MTNWADLETRGFVVVPTFLDDAAIALLADDFTNGAPPTAYPHGFKLVGRKALAALTPRLDELLARARAATSLHVDRVNFLTLSHFITTKLAERTSALHQDFDLDYQLTMDHLRYLNFWIPVVKPERAKSNVCVVPFDTLLARSPSAHARLHASGGRRLVPEGNTTRIYTSYGKILDGELPAPEVVFDFDIEELVETPEVVVGDVLIMRGDLIHRTQDTDTVRVAASLRATSSNKVITRERADAAAAGGSNSIHATIRRCFEALARDEVTIGELEAWATSGTMGSKQ